MTTAATIKVVVVDDHPLVLSGLADAINREPRMHVCATAQDSNAAQAAIVAHTPDVVLLDLFLKSRDGLELIKGWKAIWPELRILVLSMHDEAVYAERVLRAGANGYVMKSEPTEVLIAALSDVAAGELYLSRNIGRQALRRAFCRPAKKPAKPIAQLSDRELHIFQLIGRHQRRHEIATELRLSVKTIESHRENMKEKLGIKTAKGLLEAAVRWVEGGSLAPPEPSDES